ncbi:hypothetical protein Pmar_PMAR017510 [Perkinsus marinus ATCC 50983]|uniref:Uncharacterized protein n=1 Tax=Perkinsus marinus (strain ATCC 50983 / TXsc) TaxID=423536 RepID=C5LH28_PERM5|nr:hypothetical protein Pmar_PMAR017510 [Perkinsus marinus ATCC 50983]EER03965.1 hypothetical protein Pmar_PMAR017510 [Perkinsus marinus ATCC 50983]|eukprot:XP_002772149.1 hypothetical protein Pmar_PMAR017510 [Perkinsus marinus ATCC 50983]
MQTSTIWMQISVCLMANEPLAYGAIAPMFHEAPKEIVYKIESSKFDDLRGKGWMCFLDAGPRSLMYERSSKENGGTAKNLVGITCDDFTYLVINGLITTVFDKNIHAGFHYIKVEDPLKDFNSRAFQPSRVTSSGILKCREIATDLQKEFAGITNPPNVVAQKVGDEIMSKICDEYRKATQSLLRKPRSMQPTEASD